MVTSESWSNLNSLKSHSLAEEVLYIRSCQSAETRLFQKSPSHRRAVKGMLDCPLCEEHCFTFRCSSSGSPRKGLGRSA